MFRLFYYLILISAFFCNSCTTLFIANSNAPQSEVFYLNQKTGEKKSLGTTPLQLPMDEFRSKLGEEVLPGEFYKLKFEKKGYQSETYMVPATRYGTLTTKIEVTLIESKKDEEERIAKTLIDRLFMAQRLALLKEFERAQIELDKIITDHPTFVRALTMRASIYYAQGKPQESLKWYEEALKIDPQMEDVIKIAAKIKGISNSENRLPASKGKVGP